MRLIIAACVLLAGCAVNKPPDYDSSSVQLVCAAKDGETVAVSFRDQTRQVKVDIVPTWEELYNLCGETGGACVNMLTHEIHRLDDRRCEQNVSHELGHLFGVPGMDVLSKIDERRRGFYGRLYKG